jgi:hypothetical protein
MQSTVIFPESRESSNGKYAQKEVPSLDDISMPRDRLDPLNLRTSIHALGNNIKLQA